MAKRSKRGRKSNLEQYDTAALVAERDRRVAVLQERRGEAMATLAGISAPAPGRAARLPRSWSASVAPAATSATSAITNMVAKSPSRPTGPTTWL